MPAHSWYALVDSRRNDAPVDCHDVQAHAAFAQLFRLTVGVSGVEALGCAEALELEDHQPLRPRIAPERDQLAAAGKEAGGAGHSGPASEAYV